jgi:tetratricopeptide (TPR) repeat protein
MAIENQSKNPFEIFKHRFNQGITLRRLGYLEKSIYQFREAVAQVNSKASGYNNLGLSLFENKDWEDALQAFNRAI